MRLFVGFLCAALLASCARPTPEVRLISAVDWHINATWFGGFSGIDLSPNGQHATLITDKGSVVTARLTRGPTGDITAVHLLSQTPLRAANGEILKDLDTDAEGLALGADGTIYISFEQDHRVVERRAQGTTKRLPALPATAARQANKGLEALAIHPDGTLFTLSENRPARGQPFHVWQLKDSTWSIAARMPRAGLFVPVGADFDADGQLYVLERALTPLGFSSRVRRLAADGRVHTVLNTPAGDFDNLEGLSLWRDAAGKTRLTLISDDNFNRLLRTQIVEYTLP